MKVAIANKETPMTTVRLHSPMALRAGLVLLAAALLVTVLPGRADEESAVRDGVFVHLSAGPDQPHRVLMALKMAVIMAEGGRDVLVYADIEAVRLLVKDAPEVTHAAFPASTTLLARLTELGARVRACPSCLAAAGKSADDLLPGIRTADREEFFSFTRGRILTLDY